MKSKRAGKLPLSSAETPGGSFGLLDAAALQNLDAVPTRAFVPAENETAPAPSKKPLPRLVLRRETKERGGKTVVIVAGFPAGDAAGLEETARRLRKALGCGGTVSGGEIVLQGDRPEAVAATLREIGHAVRGVGA